MAKRPWRDEDALRELYVNQDNDISEMAEHFGVAISTVWYWLDKYGFDTSTWDPADERFDSNYEVDGETGCWEWTGSKSNGYGAITIDYQNIGAHRYSYLRFNGPIPDDAMICHKCHNRSCVNPDHLYAGDAKSNAQDAIEAGDWDAPEGERQHLANFSDEEVVELRERYADGETLSSLKDEFGGSLGSLSGIVNGNSYPNAGGPTDVDTKDRMKQKGEGAHQTELTEQDIREIRDRYEREDVTMADLGDEYEITSSNVCDIINRNSWSHVD